MPREPEISECVFSHCGNYRYTLIHSFRKNERDKFESADIPASEQRRMMWIGCNPSVANTQQLDNTLRRVRAFTHGFGCNTFTMLNLFAWRATDPREMRAQAAPVGGENDAYIYHHAHLHHSRGEKIVAAWGVDGSHLDRDRSVCELLRDYPLWCLGKTLAGVSRHPLYVKADTPLTPFTYQPLD